jgi:cytochrome c oxidase subunit 4
MAQDTYPVEQSHEEHGGHASLRTYVIIGVILTVVTAIEVAISYIPALSSVEVPLLLALSFAKFMLVVLFYMHLKFDSRIFSRLFYGLSVLATLLVSGLLLFYSVLGEYRP